MNLPDIRTVVLSFAVSNIICLVVITVLWFQNRRRFAGLGFWTADFIFQVGAVTLIGLRGAVPDIASETVSNSLVLAGTILLYVGLQDFTGKRSSQVHNWILLGLFTLAHAYFVVVRPDLTARSVLFSLGLLVICFQIAGFLQFQVRREMRSITRGVGWIMVFFGAISLARMAFDLDFPLQSDFFHSTLYDAVSILLYQMLYIILTFNLLLMVNHRLVIDLRSDIAGRKQTEDALRLSEEKFYKAFHSSLDAILITRLDDGRIVDVNDGFCKLFGYPREEALADSTINLHIWVNLGDRARVSEYLQLGDAIRDLEFQFRVKSGSQIVGSLSAEMITLNGQAHVLGMIRDISRQKQAADLSRFHLEMWEYSSSYSLDQLMKYALDRICLLSGSQLAICQIAEANPQMLSPLTWCSSTPEGFCQEEGPVEHDLTSQNEAWGEALRLREPVTRNRVTVQAGAQEMPQDHVWRVRQLVVPFVRNRQVVCMLEVANKPYDYDKEDVELVSNAADLVWTIASQKIAESRLQQAQVQVIEQQRELAKVEERRRVARNLHDSVNQSIHSLILFSETLAAALDKNNLTHARSVITGLQVSARQALKETRLLLFELQNEGTGRQINLVKDLEERLASVERHAGVKANFIQVGSHPDFPPEWRENLFWIASEALNNALKHARASSVTVTLRCLGNRIELEIRDSGVGFAAADEQAGGMGLGNMRARAEAIGGSLTIESQNGNGTCVRFIGELLPLS